MVFVIITKHIAIMIALLLVQWYAATSVLYMPMSYASDSYVIFSV